MVRLLCNADDFCDNKRDQCGDDSAEGAVAERRPKDESRVNGRKDVRKDESKDCRSQN